ncbi:MAG TPA: hypothetical protein ENI60_05440 [Candidatus Fraserbacteria bacterium]|nr:hypothetical protein [Candidatus Fraserbacteria bacterium]
MAESVLIKLDLPGDLAHLKLPAALNTRLQALLDEQDRQGQLSQQERAEAEGLVNLAELLSLLKLRAQQATEHNGANVS